MLVIDLRALTFVGNFEEFSFPVEVSNMRKKNLVWGKRVISRSFPWEDLHLKHLNLVFNVKSSPEQRIRVVS